MPAMREGPDEPRRHLASRYPTASGVASAEWRLTGLTAFRRGRASQVLGGALRGCYGGDGSSFATALGYARRYLTRRSRNRSMGPAAFWADTRIESGCGQAKWIPNPVCFFGCWRLLQLVRHLERLPFHLRPCLAFAGRAWPAALVKDHRVQPRWRLELAGCHDAPITKAMEGQS